MDIGGLMAFGFKVFLGNPSIMASLVTWAVLVTLSLTVIEIMKDTN